VRADEKLTAFVELECAVRARPSVSWHRLELGRFVRLF
jgi:hypothetical protein